MQLGVVRLSGAGDGDVGGRTEAELAAALGLAVRELSPEQATVADVDALVLLGSCAAAAAGEAAGARIMAGVARFAEGGGPLLGIGAGFRVLCELGLLDGTLAPGDSSSAVPDDVWCVVEGRPTPFSHAIPAGRQLRLPVGLRPGRFEHSDIDALEREGRVILRYCSAGGEVEAAASPNGSVNNVAGICNGAANVVGMVPHPERPCASAVGASAGVPSGRALFDCLRGWLGQGPARV